MGFMILAHGLYTNACMKGEECIPTTWDIFYEKFGWMLIFWNYVGVPFVYCFQSFYILKNNPQNSGWYMAALTVSVPGVFRGDDHASLFARCEALLGEIRHRLGCLLQKGALRVHPIRILDQFESVAKV